MPEMKEALNKSRIKLFGAIISLKHKSDPNNDSDPTAEKRPEKIIPCPRCKSMETKFCYFNNYNVNQPRHFCKGCQRYWTAGGALRNVPIGAGRRKAKPPSEGVLGEFPEGCFFDPASVGIGMDEWQQVEQEGFRQVFPAKKRRRGPVGQSC